MHQSLPKFQVGEIAILQPPHPSARSYWGQETTVLRVIWSERGNDAMGETRPGWSYLTDIPAPPPTDLPEDQHDHWIWCEYDLKKKHERGADFDDLIAELKDSEIIL